MPDSFSEKEGRSSRGGDSGYITTDFHTTDASGDDFSVDNDSFEYLTDDESETEGNERKRMKQKSFEEKVATKR